MELRETPIRSAAAVTAIMVVAPLAAAHNSWLVPERQDIRSGETVRVAFVTAHETFPMSEHAVDRERVESWELIADAGRTMIDAPVVDGLELVGRVRPEADGVHVVAAALRPRFIEIDAAAFDEYLLGEGADAVLAARRAAGDAGPGRELYAKFAKTFVRVGTSEAGRAATQPVGHMLEIVPRSDPTRWSAGDLVEVRVLLDGRPASGLRVSSGNEESGGHRYVESVATDRSGAARLRVGRSGLWYLRTHVIRPLKGERARETGAGWESFFASVTFRVQLRDAGPAPGQELDLDLDLVLRAPPRPVVLGEEISFRLEINNRGREPVTLVKPGDGSEVGWRTPRVGWTVRALAVADQGPAEGDPREAPLPESTPRCANTNPLRPGEVVEVGPGRSLALDGWLGRPVFPGPGRYRVAFTYENEPQLEWRGVPLGSHDPATMEQVRRSTPCRLVSNEVLVTVRRPSRR